MTMNIRNIIIAYKFNDVDDIYTKDDIKDMSMSDFKMFITFLDKKEFDIVYDIVKTVDEKRFKMEHIYRSTSNM